jgi:F-type H+-transporting ATPase subunit b
MLIDWFTVAAQAINFLILVWLLQRFLYKPILHAIDEREKGIATQLAQAEADKANAQKERDDLQHKNEAFDQERAALLKKATDEAAGERQRLLDEARKDADTLRAKRQEALRNEQRNLNQAILRCSQQEVFAITRKTLADLANASLEQRMVEVFIQRLRALSGTAKEQLAAALKASTQPARVRSAFDLPTAQRSAVESAIHETFAADIQVEFETAPEVVSGVELSTGGQKVAWSIADYLATLQKSVGELLQENTRPDSKPDAMPKPDAAAAIVPDPKVVLNPEPKSEPRPVPTHEANHKPIPVPSAPEAVH